VARGGNNKKPSKAAVPINRGKQPSGGGAASGVATRPFLWTLDSVDWGGPWSWGHVSIQQVTNDIIPTLKNCETINWANVDGPGGSHFVATSDLIKPAQERLEAIGQGDLDFLFSLRVTGARRLWGARDIATFRVFWWDPRHEVCPAMKRGT
jgi:hypothetical protein